MKKKHVLLDLYLTFFRIGLFTIGGGYVMIPLIEREMVETKKWISEEDIINIISITQTIPGALATNISALVGYKIGKIKGAIISVLGVISPSFIIIIAIAIFFKSFLEMELIQNAFLGIRSVVVALIAIVALRMLKQVIIDKFTLGITIISIVLLLFTSIEPIFVILGGIVLGIATYYMHPKHADKVLNKGVDDK